MLIAKPRTKQLAIGFQSSDIVTVQSYAMDLKYRLSKDVLGKSKQSNEESPKTLEVDILKYLVSILSIKRRMFYYGIYKVAGIQRRTATPNKTRLSRWCRNENGTVDNDMLNAYVHCYFKIHTQAWILGGSVEGCAPLVVLAGGVQKECQFLYKILIYKNNQAKAIAICV